MSESIESLKELNKRLGLRIHNQRVQLRETWETVDMRIQGGAHAAFRPLRTKWVEFGFAKIKKIKKLEADKKDILSAVARMDYGYIESAYMGYDNEGHPPE